VKQTSDVLAATDEWFLRNGLSYFVPEQRQGARAALSLRRTLPLLVLAGLAAAAAGAGLALLADEFSFAPATLVSIGILAATWYALTALNARPIVTWALSRTFGGLRTLLPMMSCSAVRPALRRLPARPAPRGGGPDRRRRG
jgi:hypothetical protein